MQWKDRLIPWYFVMFFVFIALVNSVMVTLAVRTHTGTVTSHPYEKGLAYNRVVEAQEHQAALRWKGMISYTDGVMRFALKDSRGMPVVPEQAVATITRPTQAGMDFSVTLDGGLAPIRFPAKGLWDVRVDAVARGEHYQQATRMVVP